MRIAFCGIDGAGKTTLIRGLIQRHDELPLVEIRKTRRPIVDRLRRVARLEGETYYADGPMAAAYSWAYTFDFLDYVEEVAIVDKKMSVLLLDRWRPCLEVWIRVFGGGGEADSSRVCGLIPHADYTVFLDVSPETCIARLNRRGTPRSDEALEYLRPLARGYTAYFTAFGPRLIWLREEEIGNWVETLSAFITKASSTAGIERRMPR